MSHQQGYKPDMIRSLLRNIAKVIAGLFRINGENKFGNIFLQAVDPTITIKNPLDLKSKLIFRSGHERLHWRITQTAELEKETNEWIESFRAGEVFIDIGSNIGMYSLISAQAKGTFCISFELDPLNLSLQQENIFFNNLQDSILLVPIPLSEKTAQKTVFFKTISPGDALHSLDVPSPMISDDNKKRLRTTTILSMSLDDVYRFFRLPHPNHMKLDVDGTELNILQGSVATLRFIKSIMCECTPTSKNLIDKFLFKQGFSEVQSFSNVDSQSSFNVLYQR